MYFTSTKKHGNLVTTVVVTRMFSCLVQVWYVHTFASVNSPNTPYKNRTFNLYWNAVCRAYWNSHGILFTLGIQIVPKFSFYSKAVESWVHTWVFFLAWIILYVSIQKSMILGIMPLTFQSVRKRLHVYHNPLQCTTDLDLSIFGIHCELKTQIVNLNGARYTSV